MIRLHNISKTYGEGQAAVEALKSVSLEIARGDFVAIMGASGSGKSTLMHILGLLDAPSDGAFFLYGKDVSDLTDDARAQVRNRVMGFIFQKFYLLPRLTARLNVALPLIYRGEAHLQEEAVKRLTQVGLETRMTHRPNQLSGGQQQRVAIARALIGEPDIIFADEPTGNLDSKSSDEIMVMLDSLHAEGRTIIMVTHEQDVADHAHRIIRMQDGRIVDDRRNKPLSTAAARTNGAEERLSAVLSEKRHQEQTEVMDHLRQAWGSIIANKIRTLLSVLGVLIGVGAVIAMMALGTGANESIEEQMNSLGANVLSIRPGSERVHGVALSAGSVTRFTAQDVEALAKLPQIKHVSGRVSGGAQLVYGSNNWSSQVEGVNPAYEQIRAMTPIMGRFFLDKEVTARAKVALIGTTVLKELFNNESPIGKTMRINRMNVQVIGVLPSKGQGGFRDNDDIVLMPVTTAMYRLLGKDYIDSIDVDVVSPEMIEPAKTAIGSLIKRRHRLAEDSDTFSIRDMTEFKNMLKKTTGTMTWLLSCIAAISLIVGGIGIMNIMLVSVTERTNEIGLRKAIGARRHDIMVQFLIEAILLTTTGGVIGILMGSSISFLLSALAGWATKISLSSVLIALFFSVFVGVTFGLWPAAKAARLNPIDALRYE